MNRFAFLRSSFFSVPSRVSAKQPIRQTKHFLALRQTSHNIGIQAVLFEGSRSFSAEQLRDTFNVPVGGKFNHTAIGKGLERLRQLYGDYGYINFTAVPTLQLDKDRGTVVLTISIDDGQQFTFGKLFLAGQETRAGEADALHNAWAAMSGKRYDSSLLRKWLAKNATFLPNDEQPLRHVEMHLDASTRQADFKLTFP